jgi:hypothetical protein
VISSMTWISHGRMSRDTGTSISAPSEYLA